jgi:hypothetical protein
MMVLGALLCVGLFAGMLALLEVGRRIGRRRIEAAPEGGRAGLSAIEGSVFGLFGLLVAFTFAAAATRFEARRELIIAEANEIGTAWLRLDLLPAAAQPGLRAKFRDYTDARLDAFRDATDLEAAARSVARAQALQREIWAEAVAASAAAPQSSTAMLVLSSLNSMFDVMETRMMGARAHTPTVIMVLLFGLALGCALLAGIDLAASPSRNWVHTVIFSAVVSLTVYVILDIEYPRLGLINLHAVDEVLVQVRAGMK